VANRAVVLRDGANAGALSHEDLTHDNMIRLMVGREIAPEYEAGNAHQRRDDFRVEGLRTRRYPQHAVSFGVGRGEILGFAGLIGAGRSEVARAIFGIEPRLAGTITLESASLTITGPEGAIREGIFLVPEDRRSAGLVVDFSVRENVSLPALHRYARHGIVSEVEERQAAAAVCAKLQVKTPSLEVKTATLSGGNQQKVVLAKWLALGPKVLIVDEPTRGIDVGAKAEIYRLLRDLTREGVAVIMISSDLEEILQLSDRVAVMHEGRITGVLERTECTEQRIVTLAVSPQR
jgi:ribose transport system ATP-binding protein